MLEIGVNHGGDTRLGDHNHKMKVIEHKSITKWKLSFKIKQTISLKFCINVGMFFEDQDTVDLVYGEIFRR